MRRVIAASGLTCAITEPGELYCWGSDRALNSLGGFEDQVLPRRMDGARDLTQVALSANVACAVDRDHRVWCMGFNEGGRLGTGSTEEPVTAFRRRLDVEAAVQVAVVGTALLGRRRDGSLFVQTDGRTTNLPVPSSGIVADLQSDGQRYCVVLSTGEIACATPRASGTLTEGPALVDGSTDNVSVSVGYDFACALKRDGTVWCWGNNDAGQGGTRQEESQRCPTGQSSAVGQGGRYTISYYSYCLPQPRQVRGLADVVEISSNIHITCARRRDGTVWCWGENDYPRGILGDDSSDAEICLPPPSEPFREQVAPPVHCRTHPVQIAALRDVAQISVGGRHICALLASGQVWCWGSNGTGLLGDNTTWTRTTPGPVRWPFTPTDE